jgi:hypothetical protein
MAINWKLRESVFRLLAAVYAELGEAAVSSPTDHGACPLAELINAQFKGRYASIAKFYGNDATYDAIKSFFAKEISRAAEDLHCQNPGHQRVSRPVLQKSSSLRSSRRTLHLDFNEQDISFVSEREVEAHSRHALQRPPKRPRVYESPQLHVEEEEERLVESQVVPEFSRDEIPNGIPNGFRSVNGRLPSPQLQANGNHPSDERNLSFQPEFPIPAATRELTSNSTDPSYIPSPSPIMPPPNRTRAAPKKRPYKEVPEFDLEYQTVSSSSQTGSQLTQEPESFGYVTNAGLFRCALCFSQLSSQEALDNHEAVSKLHLRNLQNPAIVSKGRAKLAQVTALPYQSSASPTAFRPLRLGGFGEREEPLTNGHAAQNGPILMNRSTDHHQLPRCQENMANSSRTMDTIEVLPRTVSSPDSPIDLSGDSNGTFRAPDIEPEAENVIDKGKRRASPYPAAAVQSHQAAPINPISHAPPVTEQQSSRRDQANSEQHDNTNRTTTNKPHPTKPPSRLRPLEVAEILRLTGIRLAEKYIAEHPDLIAQTMGRVQREFTAASASANGSVGPVNTEPPGRGEQDMEIGRRGQVNDRARRGFESRRDRNTAMEVDVVVLD